jgi:hypothetical protein
MGSPPMRPKATARSAAFPAVPMAIVVGAICDAVRPLSPGSLARIKHPPIGCSDLRRSGRTTAVGLDGPGRWAVQPLAKSPLVVFFPTVVESHLGFLVQGPYRTTPSRDNMRARSERCSAE